MAQNLVVSVDGHRQPPWEVGVAAHRRDQEAYLLIPADAVKGDRVRIEARLDPGKDALGAFHWFMLQP